MVDLDLKSHSEFFNSLIDLIPAKHYLAEADDRVDLRFVKRRERDAAKEQFKKQHKESKRQKLNPLEAKGTVDLQKAKAEKDEAALAAGASTELRAGGEGVVSRDALREKLKQRLDDMRKQRKADEQGKKVEQAKDWRDAALDKGRKMAIEKRKQEALLPKTKGASASQHANVPKSGSAKTQRGGFAFSKVDFGENPRVRKGKQKATKAELLEAAESKKAASEAVLASGATSEVQTKVEKEAWGAAMARAHGDKVLDDPRLLKRSMKKEAKIKKKKAQAWEDRQNKQKETQEARQSKRRNNLQSRITAKKDAKKARREKKLLRAGFEGRKQGFIASPSPKTL